MSEKDKEQKKLTREILQRQIDESERVILQTQRQLAILGDQLQQQMGAANYARHILANFEVPTETQPAKPPLEVK